MTTFVLVHGSWHGGWCWRKLSPFLRQAGHDVHPLTLTGLGDRAHLLSHTVGLDTHIQDVVSYLECEDLSDVILVGHSYAGMIIGAVGALVPQRIAHVVYLDAINPRDGESFYDHEPAFEPWACGRAYQVDGIDVLPPNLPTELGVTDPDDIAWMSERLRPHPLLAYAQPVRLPADGVKKLMRSYIWCTESTFLQREVELARADGWQIYELATSHEAMITVPKELARLLLEMV
jgi:pimeloyl-ACP methyl ester carboxylesterase